MNCVKIFRESHFCMCLSRSVKSLFSWDETPTTCCHEDIQAKTAHKKSEGFAFDEKACLGISIS